MCLINHILWFIRRAQGRGQERQCASEGVQGHGKARVNVRVTVRISGRKKDKNLVYAITSVMFL